MSGIFFCMELVKIGKILKTHGFKGHVRIAFDAYYQTDFEQTIKALFIDKLPYFIMVKDINSPGNAIVLLEEIDTKEKAQKICGKEIYVREEELEEIFDEERYDELIGYILIDKKLGKLGKMEDIFETPQQLLAQVTYQEKEILIPLNEDFIIKIDTKKKSISLQLPDGLIDSQ